MVTAQPNTPAASGSTAPIEIRKQRVDAEARRLVALGASGVGPLMEDGTLDHYAVGMQEPEATNSTSAESAGSIRAHSADED